MRTLSYVGRCPILKCRDRFLGSVDALSMKEHQMNFSGSTKTSAIKYLRDQFHIDNELKDKLISLRCLVNEQGNLGLADAKQIVEKYFY